MKTTPFFFISSFGVCNTQYCELDLRKVDIIYGGVKRWEEQTWGGKKEPDQTCHGPCHHEGHIQVYQDLLVWILRKFYC